MNKGNGGLRFLRLFFAFTVTILWGASVAVTLLVEGRAVDPWIHLIAAALATALFGPEIWKRGE